MNELTREQILSMPAGRELDALVAKEVFKVDNPDHRWSPSTDIAAAWEVVDKMHEYERWTLALEFYKDAGEWGAYFDDLGISPGGAGNTAQEAICKASLLAVMGL